MNFSCFSCKGKYRISPCGAIILIWLVLMLLFACGSDNERSITRIDNNQSPDTSREIMEIREDNKRLDWQKPGKVLDKLEPLGDKVIAEIGAGAGYFTFRLVPRSQKVIATDIDASMINYLDSLKDNYLSESMKDRLEIRLVEPQESGLKKNEVDVVFISNTYAYIDDRVSYLRKLKSSMKDSSSLMIVDFKMRNIPVGPSKRYKLPLYEVENELINSGFRILYADDTSLPYQYIIHAEKSASH